MADGLVFGGGKKKVGAPLPHAPANRKPAAAKPAKPQQRATLALTHQGAPGTKELAPVVPKPEARALKPRGAAPKPAAPKVAPQSTGPKPAAPKPAPKPATAARTPVVPVPKPKPAAALKPAAAAKPAATSKPMAAPKPAAPPKPAAAPKQPVDGALVKKPKKHKKHKKSVTAAGPRDTSPEEGRPTPLRQWWREITLGLIVLVWIVVYVVAHPRRASASRGAGVFEFEARGGKIYANGELFSIKGVNWFGSEAFNGPPGGLDKHSVSWYLDFLERNEFNAIRLLFNHEDVMKNDIVEAPHGAQLLFQTRYVEMFGVLASEAARRGILVMIACHRINKDAWPGKGLWYDEALNFPEKRVMESWSKIAGHLCEHWNVFAADLQNEPHASSWGKGLASDWNKAAERIGDHVLGLCPRWLIMVEGVGFTPGAPGADDPGAGYWWGENIVGAKVAPVRLRDQSKLVCAPMLKAQRPCVPLPRNTSCMRVLRGVADSPHVYGPSVYMQHYFEAPNFPDNMPAVWNDHFAFAQEELGISIVIGEIGGDYSGDDRLWQDWAIPYVKKRGFGIFYFALNPDSEDTGGLVPKDWSVPKEGSPEFDKLKALSELPSTNVFSICAACRPSSEQNSAQASKPAGKPLIGAVDAVLLAAVLLVVSAAGLMRLRKGRRRAATVPTSDGTEEEEEEGGVPQP